jgi:hypothetical protein
MPAKSNTYLAAALLLILCLGIPYGLHVEEQLREILRLSQLPAPQEEAPAAPVSLTPAEPEANPEPEIEAEKSARPSLSAPNSYLESLLEEARTRAALDPTDAMAWLQEQDPGAPRLQAMLEVVALWASKDAEGALLWLESNAHGLARSETLKNGVTLWSEKDPVSAASWIDGMANDGSKDLAAATLAESWGQRDPASAATWVESIATGPSRLAAATALLDSWSQKDPTAAADWAAREALLGSTQPLEHCLNRISQTDPTTAEALLRSYRKTFPQAPLLESYVQTLARNDPARAANWFDNLPEGDPLKNDAASQALLQEWTRSDSVAASVWLSEKTPGPQRDAAINGFVQSIKAHAPEAAATWSNAMSDPEARVRNLAQSLESWSERDPSAAAAWLQEAELEPDLRRELSWVIEN